jgi:hypothetical protein
MHGKYTAPGKIQKGKKRRTILCTTLICMRFAWRLAYHPLHCQGKLIQVERFLKGRELALFDFRPERF